MECHIFHVMLRDSNGLVRPFPFETRSRIPLEGNLHSEDSVDTFSTPLQDFVTDEIQTVEDVDRFINFRNELIAPRMLNNSAKSGEFLDELSEDDLMFVERNQQLLPDNGPPVTPTMRLDQVDEKFSSSLLPMSVDSGIESGGEDYRVEQYAHSVLDFSSQYGIDLSISYTAPNITGQPTIYPECGDFPQTFAMASTQQYINTICLDSFPDSNLCLVWRTT